MEINTLKTGWLVGCVCTCLIYSSISWNRQVILYVLHVAMQQDPFARHINSCYYFSPGKEWSWFSFSRTIRTHRIGQLLSLLGRPKKRYWAIPCVTRVNHFSIE
jgi:hypothetical protein